MKSKTMAKPELTPEQQEDTVIVGGSISPELAVGAAETLNMDAGELLRKQFPDGEMFAQFEESVRGRDVFIIQPHAANKRQGLTINDAVQEHLVIIDAAMRGSATRITAIAPVFGYARQDRKKNGREPISAKLLCNQFKAAGANKMMAIDLHSPQIHGFFDPTFDNLTAMRMLRRKVSELIPKRQKSQWAMVALDLGRATAAEKWSQKLDIDLVVINKGRDKEGRVSTRGTSQSSEVEGRNCVVIDDMIDTAGTLVNGLEVVHSFGAKKIIVASTHPYFSDKAIEKIQASPINTIVTTNTIPTEDAQEVLKDRLIVLDISSIIGSAIGEIVTKGSVSKMFKGEDRS